MKVFLFGGFGEKGRVCIGVESGAGRVLIDVGVRTEGDETDRYPVVSSEFLQQTHGIIITHAHEDHIGAAGYCVRHGFKGSFYLTKATWNEARQALQAYTPPADLAAFDKAPIKIIDPCGTHQIGDLTVKTGRSGHAVGGIWVAVGDGKRKIVHCGDVIPQSPVLAMDPIPACDVLVIDASYGADTVAFSVRAARIRSWVADAGACLLPTPATGRVLELLALLGGGVSIHAGLRRGLEEQLRAKDWFVPGAAENLAENLARCADWTEGMAWPHTALLADDAMGLAGPARRLIPWAARQGVPVLGTGYLPQGSPLAQAHATGKADWLRFPTHPTGPENAEMVRSSRAKMVIAHSCPPSEMMELTQALPGLDANLKTGDSFAV
ncbi:Ribonuclease J (endonuclease and 5' exonuclease) [hydrothermal vent metagenome]|uniref:Ribonuclease J (Endonuclease and 5' exonuclease) n=1 Tax=hydrothermal vent metagenome TaxID=652676 RepID=A0A3B0TMV8_9ZZZZ